MLNIVVVAVLSDAARLSKMLDMLEFVRLDELSYTSAAAALAAAFMTSDTQLAMQLGRDTSSVMLVTFVSFNSDMKALVVVTLVGVTFAPVKACETEERRRAETFVDVTPVAFSLVLLTSSTVEVLVVIIVVLVLMLLVVVVVTIVVEVVEVLVEVDVVDVMGSHAASARYTM
jgi:hypothetical protein